MTPFADVLAGIATADQDTTYRINAQFSSGRNDGLTI
jgi:hypothetical protein